jgi:hypothetical protein
VNLVQIARRVKSESGRSGSGPASVALATGDDRRIIDACIDEWRDIQLEPYQWRWMRRSARVTLPLQMSHTTASLGLSRMARPKRQNDDYFVTAALESDPTREWQVREVSWDWFRQNLIVNTPASGPAQFWSWSPERELYVGPTPDQSQLLRLDYFVKPQELAADADTPEMPEEYHMLIVWRALMSIGVFDAANEIYVRARDGADAMMDRLIDDQGEKMIVSARPLA